MSRLTLTEPEQTRSDVKSDLAQTQTFVVDHFQFAPFEETGPGELVEGFPLRYIENYAAAAVRHARVREVDPGVWVAGVVGLDGANADGDSPEEALNGLREAIVGWVIVKRRIGARDIPVISGFDVNPV